MKMERASAPRPVPGCPGTLLPAPLLSGALLMKEGWGLRCCSPNRLRPRSQCALGKVPPPPLLLSSLIFWFGFSCFVFLQLPAWREDGPDLQPQSGRQMGQETGSLFQPLPLFILDRSQQ